MDGMTAIEEFVNTIKEPQEDVTTTYSGVVSRVDSEGTVWVYMAGSDKETPTASASSEIKRGDFVNLEWRNNKLYIVGNTTNPSAGVERVSGIENLANSAVADAMRARAAADNAEATANAVSGIAERAQQEASAASSAASAASQAAGQAQSAATAASSQAQAALTAANSAQSSADAAALSATSANAAANGALDSLATVQDVMGVLNWASKNAEYELTTDTEIVAGKTYWTRSGAGTESDPYVYTPVVNPIVADLGTYYEISSVDEAMADYINSHLALTDEGLYVLSDDSEWKVLIAADGVYIKDSTGRTVGSFNAHGITLGDLSGASFVNIKSDGFGYTMDGGQSESIAAKLYSGSASSTSYFIGVLVLAPQWTVPNQISLNANIAMGQTITANMTLESPYGSGSTYTETFTFTAGTAATHEAFEYIDSDQYRHIVSFAYDGNRTIIVRSAYKWNVAIENSTIAYYVQNDRSAYFTFGERTGNAGKYSGIIGQGLKAQYDHQVAVGRYNDNQSGNLFEVGNGTSNANRSNAFEVNDAGDMTAAGDVTDGSGNVLADKADTSDLAAVATSGNYSDLSGKPTIPTATSDLTNDSGFIAEDSNGDISVTRNVTAGGDITDGTGNVLADKADTSDLASVATSGDYDDLTNKPTIPAAPADYVTSKGSSGNWTYRKWNSGKIEAWFSGTLSAGSTSSAGQIYRSAWSGTIPSAIGFVSTPKLLLGGNNYNSNGVFAITGAATSTTAMGGYVFRTNSSSSSYNWYGSIYAWTD